MTSERLPATQPAALAARPPASRPARWQESGPLTIGDVLRLPATVDLTTAGRALGFGRSKAYVLARNGEFPCRVIRAGQTYRVPTPAILEALGIDLASLVMGGARPQAGGRDA